MVLATNPSFDDFIRGVRLSTKREQNSLSLSAAVNSSAWYLTPPEAEMQLASAIRFIDRGLTAAGCDANSAICTALIGILAASSTTSSPPTEALNRLLTSALAGKLHVHVILPMTCDSGYSTRVADCEIHAFDPARLSYWASKGRSSFPIDIQALRGRAAISSEASNVRLVDLTTIMDDVVASSGVSTMQVVADAYFNAVFEYRVKQIPAAVRQALRIFEAGRVLHFDMASFVDAFLSIRLGLFHWATKPGGHKTWAVMNTQAAVSINLPPQGQLAACYGWLETELGYTGTDPENAFSKTLDFYCDVLQRGREHERHGRHNEAALHSVIALDFLFGANNRATDSIAERSAVLTHQAAGRTYDEQYKHVKDLYDARSRYVHSGRELTAAQANDIDRVATQVLWALVRVSAKQKFGSTAEWLKEVDYVQGAICAGREVSDLDSQAIGVHSIEVHCEHGML
jgi:hypothetical protein